MVIFLLPKMPVPSFAVALTFTVPLAFAVSKPVALISAKLSPAEIDHVTVLSSASAGKTAAFICNVPAAVVMDVALFAPVTVIEVTSIGCMITVCPLICISISPNTSEASLADALTVTVPFDFAVSKPVALISAKSPPADIDHVTSCRLH